MSLTDMNAIAYTNAAAGLNNSSASVHPFALSNASRPVEVPDAYARIGITAARITNIASRMNENRICATEAIIDRIDPISTIPAIPALPTAPPHALAIFHPSGISASPARNTRMPSLACCFAPSRIHTPSPSVNRVARITPGIHTAEVTMIRPKVRTKSWTLSSASDHRDRVNRTPIAISDTTPRSACTQMV
ncbi:hypothetical protein [Corynebacterium bovis]|uniref:hypothetical protein n=1 Tax=Corynebacterium bovis TaxID=36808 RepID=UPI0031394A9C